MKKNINKSKIYMIICVCILCISILGSTFAFYRIELFGINTSTSTQGLDYYINYAKGQDISGAELSFVDSYLEGVSTDVEFWKKDNTYDIYGHIYLDINEIGVNLASSDVLKYTVVNNGNIISEGTFKGRSSGESVLIASNIPLEVSKQLYTVYVWLGEGESVDASMENETVSLTVRCEATMKPYVTLFEHITNLYTSGNPTLITQKDTDGNEIADYYYSYQDDIKTWGLMNDGFKIDNTLDATTTGLATTVTDPNALTSGTEGNIRYFGPHDSVRNYIYFNCETYPSTNCELWRIIGIVDGKVKIIRNESIGSYSWDNKNTATGAETHYGSNDWSDARLMRLLNPGYENYVDKDNSGNDLIANNSLYWNSGSGTCYYGIDNATKTCDFTTTGLKNDTTVNMIPESTWYLGGYEDPCLYPNQIYNYERTNKEGTTIYSGNPYTINANIGLMYPSDYGYGTDLTMCSSNLCSYNSVCAYNNWLFNNNDQWLMTHNASYSSLAWNLVSSGRLRDSYFVSNVFNDYDVRPVLYLDSELIIDSGNKGTSTDPYRIIA